MEARKKAIVVVAMSFLALLFNFAEVPPSPSHTFMHAVMEERARVTSGVFQGSPLLSLPFVAATDPVIRALVRAAPSRSCSRITVDDVGAAVPKLRLVSPLVAACDEHSKATGMRQWATEDFRSAGWESDAMVSRVVQARAGGLARCILRSASWWSASRGTCSAECRMSSRKSSRLIGCRWRGRRRFRIRAQRFWLWCVFGAWRLIPSPPYGPRHVD